MNNVFMKRAVALAELSALEGEVPVGAVVVKDNKIVGEGRNRREFIFIRADLRVFFHS